MKLTPKVEQAVKALADAAQLKTSVCTLVMVVSYDSTPDHGEFDRLIDTAREQGGVDVAELFRLAPVRESLV